MKIIEKNEDCKVVWNVTFSVIFENSKNEFETNCSSGLVLVIKDSQLYECDIIKFDNCDGWWFRFAADLDILSYV